MLEPSAIDTTVLPNDLAYFHSLRAALFPCAAGTKRPILPWKTGSSHDPIHWQNWRAEGHNLAIDAARSNLIIIDVDASKVPAAEAWAAFDTLCKSWNIPTPNPTTSTARGGWHVFFQRPADVPAESLRGGGTLVSSPAGEVVGFKNRGYCVAPGSTFEGLPYRFYPDAPAPPPCPAALLALLHLPVVEATYKGEAGTSDTTDVARLVAELDMFGEFSVEPDWFKYMGAIKLALGDTDEAVQVALQMTQDDASEEAFQSRWKRLASVDNGTSNCRIGSMIHRYKQLTGKNFHVRKSSKGMFSGVVATLAANAGATLPSLIGNTHKIIANQGEPYLTRFFETTSDVPNSPNRTNYPTIPDSLEELYPSIFDAMRSAITRIVVMAQTPRTFNQRRILRVLGVLHHMHEPTCQALVDYIHGLNSALSQNSVDVAAKDFEKEINADINSGRTAFWSDAKGKPDPAISNNVGIFLNRSNHRARWDIFSRQIEMAHEQDAFTHFDQDELDRLWMMAKSIDYNYHPPKDLFNTGIKVTAKREQYDALEDEVLRLSDAWDGVPRLDTWLSRTCNVPEDTYHRTVGRNLIGGMVKRARTPGEKHDETVIFISPEQGTGKSSIAGVLARKDDWLLEKFKLGQSDQNSLPLLAGKWVVELGELAGLSKTDFEDTKTFLSNRIDTYVAKYEVLPTKNPRRCIFIGTSNLRQPLADPSGNRRFLPVHVIGRSNLDWLRSNVDQIIGEAARRHAAGELFSIPEELWTLTAAAQESARSMTAVEEAIHDWFDRDGSLYIVAGDIGRALKMAGLPAQSRYGVYMEKLGWHFAQVGSARTRTWIKHTSSNISECVVLEPSQSMANGRVEMRMRASVR